MSILSAPTKSVIMGGLFLVVPLIVMIIIGKNAIEILSPLGKNIGHRIGVSSIFGKATLTIICLLLLLFFCYLAGLLLRYSMVSKFGDSVEEKIYLFFPQLQILKYKIAGESSMKSVWTPILMKEENHYVLVFVTCSLDEPVLSIFVPECPRLDSGEIRYMKKEDCVYELISMKQAMDAVVSFGKKGNLKKEIERRINKENNP